MSRWSLGQVDSFPTQGMIRLIDDIVAYMMVCEDPGRLGKCAFYTKIFTHWTDWGHFFLDEWNSGKKVHCHGEGHYFFTCLPRIWSLRITSHICYFTGTMPTQCHTCKEFPNSSFLRSVWLHLGTQFVIWSRHPELQVIWLAEEIYLIDIMSHRMFEAGKWKKMRRRGLPWTSWLLTALWIIILPTVPCALWHPPPSALHPTGPAQLSKGPSTFFHHGFFSTMTPDSAQTLCQLHSGWKRPQTVTYVGYTWGLIRSHFGSFIFADLHWHWLERWQHVEDFFFSLVPLIKGPSSCPMLMSSQSILIKLLVQSSSAQAMTPLFEFREHWKNLWRYATAMNFEKCFKIEDNAKQHALTHVKRCDNSVWMALHVLVFQQCPHRFIYTLSKQHVSTSYIGEILQKRGSELVSSCWLSLFPVRSNSWGDKFWAWDGKYLSDPWNFWLFWDWALVRIQSKLSLCLAPFHLTLMASL